MSSRRPARQRKPNPKYAHDALVGYESLEDTIGDVELPDSDSGDDFAEDVHAEPDDIEGDDLSVASDDVDSQSREDDERLSDVLEDEDELPGLTNGDVTRRRSISNQGPSQQFPAAEGSEVDSYSDLEKHSRGVTLDRKRPGRDPGGNMMIGDDPAEAAALVQAKDAFFVEVTLPNRQIAVDYPGMEPPSWTKDANSDRGGWEVTLAQSQQMIPLDGTAVQRYTTGRCHKPILTGPPRQVKVTSLPPQEAKCIDSLGTTDGSTSAQTGHRPAWLLNIGEAVQCLEWAPNRKDGRHFLAVATIPPVLPELFGPSAPTPAAIEIWEFQAATQPRADLAATMNMTMPPRRRQVLCVEFGPVIQMRWGPKTTSHSSGDLGLLAVVGTDGHLRVVSVSSSEQPAALKVQAVPINISVPNTLCSCVTWLSDSLVAVGCANGYVGVWDLETCISKGCTTPVFWHEIHLTYVLSIERCLPSRPGVIITSSMDGFVRYTSIANPAMDWVHGTRSRMGSRLLLWHDQSQHSIHVEDLYNVRAMNLRRAWASEYVVTLGAPAQSAALSQHHSAMLLGCTDGSVQVVNPMRRTFAKSFYNADYQQTWFTHDWRRGWATDEGSLDYPQGLGRLTSGYAVENAREASAAALFNKNSHGPESQRQSRVTDDNVTIATTYEEEAGVRAVSWNPNATAQGWAAAGMGSGLVVVEDLCWN
ncbi:hypothetical protein FH972_021649 [Carpinus fangiana]|uniref:Uncharacterized protein n=1 Tax=Carpinus fangiana TaxID=176857 RepID=A0A5N6KQK7_9ROSI|nr:hypothetical protein FH972_021649 [Carpinus fangiana]